MDHLVDTSRPEIARAIDLARELVEHCKLHNFSDDCEIFGVGLNAERLKEKAYLDGKNYEKDRIASLLGLSR